MDSGGGVSQLGALQPEPRVRFEWVILDRGPPWGWPDACGLDPRGYAHCWGGVGRVSEARFRSLTVTQSGDCGPDLQGEAACVDEADWRSWPGPEAPFLDWRLTYGLDGVLEADGSIDVHSDTALGYPEVGGPWPGPYTAFDLVESEVGVCALDAAGAVSCWNPERDGTPSSPVLTGVPEGTYRALCMTDVGGACVLDEAGYPTCWGNDVTGEPAVALQALSCGAYSACGITLDGQIECWGKCAYHECDVPE